MAKFRLGVTNIEYGCMEIEAETFEEAMDKAYSFDGDYFVHNNELTDIHLIEKEE
jgi:hypothetical protein